jgi:hypothetical protein
VAVSEAVAVVVSIITNPLPDVDLHFMMIRRISQQDQGQSGTQSILDTVASPDNSRHHQADIIADAQPVLRIHQVKRKHHRQDDATMMGIIIIAVVAVAVAVRSVVVDARTVKAEGMSIVEAVDTTMRARVDATMRARVDATMRVKVDATTRVKADMTTRVEADVKTTEADVTTTEADVMMTETDVMIASDMMMTAEDAMRDARMVMIDVIDMIQDGIVKEDRLHQRRIVTRVVLVVADINHRAIVAEIKQEKRVVIVVEEDMIKDEMFFLL